jgi:hypothetical protein
MSTPASAMAFNAAAFRGLSSYEESSRVPSRSKTATRGMGAVGYAATASL